MKNLYNKNISGVGYLGEGKYNRKDYFKIYYIWTQMLQRCYNPYCINKHPTYKDCYVCEEWHCFQNFAKWYEDNYYEVPNEEMCLDKDILFKGNKIYSPETCIIVPKRINSLFVKSNNLRGKYPIGVVYDKERNNLRVYCNICENKKNKTKSLGRFPLNRPFQAFTCYKEFKENYIKQVAEEYKEFIPIELYNAMYNYQIEIND